MNAAVLHALGKPHRCEQFPEPIAGDDEVIVHVHAASLKPIDKQLAGGSHYASPHDFPLVCGSDGVGHLSDGQRVFFGGTRAPYGATAQRTVVRRAFSFPVPDSFHLEQRIFSVPSTSQQPAATPHSKVQRSGTPSQRRALTSG